MTIQQGVTIRIVWYDESILELVVLASNGRFSGCTRFYEKLDVASSLSDAIAGFPIGRKDERTVILGDPENGSGALLRLRCLNDLGRSEASVELRSDERDAGGARESINLTIPIEAAGIDRFCYELLRMKTEQGETAVLSAAA